MQLDQRDEFVAEVMPKLLQKLEQSRSIWQSPQHDKIMAKLKAWDYVLHKDSIEASLYHVWEYLFQHSLFKLVDLTEEEVHAIVNHGYFENYQFLLLEKIGMGKLSNEERAVCESHETQKLKDLHPCEASALLAFKELPNELSKLFGSDDLEDCRWGVIHNQMFKIIPMSDIPVLRSIWQRSYPTGGNSRTLNVAILTHQSKSYHSLGNAVFRLITDLNDTYYSLDAGESDRIFSPYYDNFVNKDKYVRYTPRNLFQQ